MNADEVLSYYRPNVFDNPNYWTYKVLKVEGGFRINGPGFNFGVDLILDTEEGAFGLANLLSRAYNQGIWEQKRVARDAMKTITG